MRKLSLLCLLVIGCGAPADMCEKVTARAAKCLGVDVSDARAEIAQCKMNYAELTPEDQKRLYQKQLVMYKLTCDEIRARYGEQ